jgi:hypothetical protein
MKNRILSVVLVFFALGLFAQTETPTASLKKAIVPLVGSTPGANGALFKTTLRIQALAGAHGRIVFHPLGTIARDSDPSIPYHFAENAGVVDYIQYDDVVAAMGQTGLGSLDIIPDAGSANIIPPVTTRIFNDTPGGTFGTDEQAIYPLNYFVELYGRPPARGVAVLNSITFVPPMSTQFRRNIGFRTLSNAIFTAYIARKDGTIEPSVVGAFPGEYSTMMSIEEFARQYMHTTIGPEDGLGIWAMRGKAILFYTYTDNGTNDPSLVISPPVDQNVLLLDIP